MGLPFQGVTICKKPMSFDLEKTDISDDHLFHGRWASSVSEILVLSHGFLSILKRCMHG